MGGRVRHRLSGLGAEGLTTLLLSNLVLLMTGGIYFGWQLTRVVATARRAGTKFAGDAILLVLGMRLRGESLRRDYRQRLDRAARLYADDERRSILVLGGYSGTGRVSEAGCGRNYLLSRGIPASAILTEEASLDSLENLRNARSILEDIQGKSLILISSRYHLARVLLIAEGLGLRLQPCGAEDRFTWTPRHLPRLLLEAYYLHWYQVGAVWSRLIGWRRGLERIS